MDQPIRESLASYAGRMKATVVSRGIVPYALVLAHSDYEGVVQELRASGDAFRTMAAFGGDLDAGVIEELHGMKVVKGPHSGLLVPLKDPWQRDAFSR